MNHKAGLLAAVCVLAASFAVRGAVFEFDATLSGLNEASPNASLGTGTAEVFYDSIAHLLEVKVDFSGLSAGVTASHIHAATVNPGTGTAGVATTVPTFTGFPTAVTSGSYDHTFDLTLLTSFNPAFVTANGGTAASAEIALVDALMAGKSYLNIHTTEFPGGEIRGFLTLKTNNVPDAGTTAGLFALGLFSLFAVARIPRLQPVPLRR